LSGIKVHILPLVRQKSVLVDQIQMSKSKYESEEVFKFPHLCFQPKNTNN